MNQEKDLTALAIPASKMNINTNLVYKYIGRKPKKDTWNNIKIIKAKMMKRTNTLYLYVRIVK